MRSWPPKVEKGHANIQVDQNQNGHGCKRPHTIQQDSFVLSACLERARIKAAVEDEVLGESKAKVFRCLRHRLVDSSAPGAALSTKKKRHGELGGIGKLLAVRCGQVRKTCVKTRQISAYNAFQSFRKQLESRSMKCCFHFHVSGNSSSRGSRTSGQVMVA